MNKTVREIVCELLNVGVYRVVKGEKRKMKAVRELQQWCCVSVEEAEHEVIVRPKGVVIERRPIVVTL